MFIEEEERREREGLDYAILGVKKASSQKMPVEFLRVPGLRKISPTVSFYLTSVFAEWSQQLRFRTQRMIF